MGDLSTPAVMKLCCLHGRSSLPIDLAAASQLFCFWKREKLFGGRLLVLEESASMWLYASGKISVLSGEIDVATASYVRLCQRLKERGLVTQVSDPTPWNSTWKVEASSSKRLSLRKVAARVPGGRFLRTQRAVFCKLETGVQEVSRRGLIQIYGSGKLLIRTRGEVLSREAMGHLIPVVRDS